MEETQQSSTTLPTLRSRRVLEVPAELVPLLNVCASRFGTCVHCAAESARTVFCENCHVSIMYCNDACRHQGLAAHKSAGHCQEIQSLRDRFRQAGLNPNPVTHIVRNVRYIERALNGRNFQHLMAGQFSKDPFLKPILDYYNELALKLALHPTSAHATEKTLFVLLLMKKMTYLSDPYNLDVGMVSALLKLYREDDSVSYILYWLDWRDRGSDIENLRDHVIENCQFSSTLSTTYWPFPVTKDARLDDVVERFRNFPAERVGISVPIEFALAVLVIKMRFITVYRKRAESETLYLCLNKGGVGLKMLGSDHRAHILSFLIEGGRARYHAQVDHVNRLLDYIDERDPALLPSLVDPAVQARRSRDQVNFVKFLADYANGVPVIGSIKSMLVERYYTTARSRVSLSRRQRIHDARHWVYPLAWFGFLAYTVLTHQRKRS